jgi:hypothetical protein
MVPPFGSGIMHPVGEVGSNFDLRLVPLYRLSKSEGAVSSIMATPPPPDYYR